MSELKVKITPTIKRKYSIQGNSIDFSELEEKIKLSIASDRLDRIVRVAKENGLSKMPNKEIDQVIKEVRGNGQDSR